MSSPSRPISRYQRRILAWGAGLTCLLYVVGAPIYLDRVESDLTERVGAELVAAGFDGVTVSFSGQTGSISCDAPLDDPWAALDVAYDVRGVRAMDDLPDSCRLITTPTDDVDETDDTAAAVSTTVATTTTTSTTPTEPDFASVLDVLAGNPQFSLLDQLVGDAGLTQALTDGGPLTLFAPTDSAFDALPADAVAQLRSDPETLERVLRHHVVEQQLLVGQLTDGALTTAAGDQVVVDVGGASPRVDGATIVEPDVLAANGVVHAIDELLLPDDVDLSAPGDLAPVNADFDGASYVLRGVVRSEVERTILVEAAAGAVGAEAVTDELTVDPDLGLGEETAQQVASLVAAIPLHLLEGTAAFDGDMLTVVGTYGDDAGRAAMSDVAAQVDAEPTLTAAQAPAVGDPAALEAALNAIVAAEPILFQPSSAVLDDTAGAVLDQLAARLQGTNRLTVTVEGHTDSDGDPQANLELSEQRATAVRDELVARGIAAATLVAEGFGSTRPVLIDGVEDKDASRRVEFRVVAS